MRRSTSISPPAAAAIAVLLFAAIYGAGIGTLYLAHNLTVPAEHVATAAAMIFGPRALRHEHAEDHDEYQLRTVASITAGPRLEVTLDRLEHPEGVEHEVTFNAPAGAVDDPTIDAADIGAVIDALEELRRAWITDGGAA